MVDKVTFDSFRLDRRKIGSMLEQMMGLVHKAHVRLEPNFASLDVI